MITVHNLEDARFLRILWLLEELGVKYEIKLYSRDRDLLTPASLRAIHPLGKSPVITDGHAAQTRQEIDGSPLK